jgi:HeH/LEM domain
MAEGQNFNDMTVTELKAYLDDHGVEYPANALKSDLVTLAEDHATAPDHDHTDTSADTAPGPEPLDGIQAVNEATSNLSSVDVDYPEGMPGPRPAASRPLDPDAKMSTIEDEGKK